VMVVPAGAVACCRQRLRLRLAGQHCRRW
jgi:hypothetical protein